MSDYLCDDLIVEIFKRLPPKSLIRFTLLSQSLRSCITSSDFIRMHTSRSPQKRLVLTHAVKRKYINEYGDHAFCTLHAEDQLPLSPIRGYIGTTAVMFPHKNVNIVGSCNGILCLFDYKKGITSLWNPSIMHQLTLPDCPRRYNKKGLGLGLGFDPITDDNKIVSIPLYGGTIERTFVYAMKIGAWCPIFSPMPLYSNVFSRSCHLNGVLHWLVGDGAPLYIMTLDLSTHVFGRIDLPKPNSEAQQLIIIEGSLVVISRVSADAWIWVRRDASCTLVFQWIAHPPVFYRETRTQVEAWVSKFLDSNGFLLLDTFCEWSQGYNPKRARSTLVDFNDTSFLFDIDMYVESLQLLDTGTPCEVNKLPSSFAGKKRRRI